MTKSADCDDAETLRRRVVRLEDALAESKTRLQAVIDAAPSLIFVRDRDGRYVVSNREFARLHGLEPQDVEGKTPYDFCPTDVTDLERTDQSPSPQSKEPLAGGFVHRFNHLLAAVIGNLGLHRDDGGR